jgi:hypothetical protein
MAICPCCSGILLSQFRQGSLSLWCRSCYAEMPDLSQYPLASVVASAVAVVPVQPRVRVLQPMQAVAVQKPPRIVNNISVIAQRHLRESVA